MVRRRGKRALLFLCVLSVVVTGAAAVPLARLAREEWYIRKLGSDNLIQVAEAAARLGKMRSRRAIPYLTNLLGKASTFDMIDFEDTTARRALAAIGPAGLAALFRHDSAEGISSSLTEEPEPDLLEAVIACLENPDAVVRQHALHALLSFDAEQPAVGDAILRVLAHGRPEFRLRAAVHLREKDLEVEAWRSALLDLAADPDRDVRLEAVSLLGGLHEQDGRALPAMVRALRDPDPDVWAHAAHALAQAAASLRDPATELQAAVPPLLERLERDPTVVVTAARALGSIGKGASAAVPALLRRLQDEWPDARVQAAFALGNIGAEARTVVPALVDRLKDGNPFAREAAAVALGRFGKEASAAVPALLEALPELGGEAAYSLARLAADAGTFPAILEKALTTRESPAEALRLLEAAAPAGVRAGDAAATLLAVAGDRTRPARARENALAALARLGPREEAAPALVALLAEVEIHPEDVIILLGEPAVPALAAGLTSSPDPVRLRIARLLGRMGSSARGAVAALEVAGRETENPDLRLEAARALETIENR